MSLRTKVKMNKKGDIGDFIHLIVAVFMIGLMFFIGGTVWSEFKENIAQNEDIMDAENVNMTEQLETMDTPIEILDPLFALFFFGFFMALLVSVFYLDTHPGFMVFGILMFIVILFIGMVMSDVFATAASTPEFSDGMNIYPITYHIVSNLPIYLLVMGLIFFILLYSTRSAQYG